MWWCIEAPNPERACQMRKTACVNYTSESLVRSSGFEPPRYCYRQPLKLVRLPVPPRPHRGEMDILTGSEEGCKPGDATRAAGWLPSSLTSKQFFFPGRSPRCQNCQQGGHHWQSGDIAS
jgi:hypothetical protein